MSSLLGVPVLYVYSLCVSNKFPDLGRAPTRSIIIILTHCFSRLCRQTPVSVSNTLTCHMTLVPGLYILTIFLHTLPHSECDLGVATILCHVWIVWGPSNRHILWCYPLADSLLGSFGSWHGQYTCSNLQSGSSDGICMCTRRALLASIPREPFGGHNK